MGRLLRPQPELFHAAIEKDIVYTPHWLARAVVTHFRPEGATLDPCRGDGAFYSLLPVGAQWCEVAEGRDFFAFDGSVDWVIGNPPYSCLLAWIRHSFRVARHVVYLMPIHRVFASAEFLADVLAWGGIREILLIGTGTTAGFPFGHALGAVHYERGYTGPTAWRQAPAKSNNEVLGLEPGAARQDETEKSSEGPSLLPGDPGQDEQGESQ